MEDETLWTPDDLARFLGYAPSTVARLVSGQPHRLPPRVAALSKPRWVPQVCREWAMSHAVQPPKPGRPRRVVSA